MSPRGPGRAGALLAVYAPRGGVGATCVAVLLAAQAARGGGPVLLADLRPFFGTSDAACGWRPREDLAAYLGGAREPGDAGVGPLPFRLVMAPRDLQGALALDPDEVEAFLRAEVRAGALVVALLPPGAPPLARRILPAADCVVLVGSADLQGALIQRRAERLLADLGVHRRRVRGVLNRFHENAGLPRPTLRGVLAAPTRVVLEDPLGALAELTARGELAEAPARMPGHPLVREVSRVLAWLARGRADAPRARAAA